MKRGFLKIVSLVLLLTGTLHAKGYEVISFQDSSRVNELLLYSVPSYIPLNWSSPSTLMETSIDSFILSRFAKNTYSIGHMLIVLNTPLADSTVRMAMRSTSNSEKIRLFIKDGVGLGILGAPMKGRLESNSEIEEFIDYYQSNKRKKISFLRYLLNDKAAERVLKFFSIFSGDDDPDYRPYQYYGGDFWPRFENEGAGCSAFAIAALDAAGIPIDNPDWFVSVNIPENIVGGPYNNGKKVKGVDIEYARRWHNGEGTVNVDFFPYTVYDPSKLYNWIQKIYEEPEDGYKPWNIGRIRGLSYDARHIVPDLNEPIIKTRKKHSVFVSVFLENR